MAQQEMKTYKVVTLGDPGVGKTSLLDRFVRGRFTSTPQVSIGGAPSTKIVQVDGVYVQFELWDAGREKHQMLTPSYLRDAAAAIVVYDTANAESFRQGVAKWLRELQRLAPECVVAIVGTKSDLVAERKMVKGEGQVLAARQRGGGVFEETSAKTNLGVVDLFLKLGRKLLERERVQGEIEADTMQALLRSSPSKEFRYSRLFLVGKGRAGKTALARGLQGKGFEETASTVGVEQATLEVEKTEVEAGAGWRPYEGVHSELDQADRKSVV